MIGRRERGELPTGHLVIRTALGGLVILLFLAVIALIVAKSGAELAAGRAISDTVKNWLLP